MPAKDRPSPARRNSARKARKQAKRAAPKRASLGGRLRGYFLAGVLVTAPFAITIYLAWLFIKFVDSKVMVLIPQPYNPETYLPFSIPGLGVVIVFVFLVLVGSIAAGFVGRLMLRYGERVMNNTPVLRSVYNAAKQIMETVLSQQSNAFRQVVLVEYPRRGIWAIGFITGDPGEEVQSHTKQDTVGVMIPTTPNPTSGFLLFFPRDEVVLLDMSVEDGMKLVISIGMVNPESAKADPLAPPEDPKPAPRARSGKPAAVR